MLSLTITNGIPTVYNPDRPTIRTRTEFTLRNIIPKRKEYVERGFDFTEETKKCFNITN